MPHDQQVGAGQEICHSGNRFHQDSTSFRVAQGGGLLYRLFGFLAFPDFNAEIIHDGKLQFIVSLV